MLCQFDTATILEVWSNVPAASRWNVAQGHLTISLKVSFLLSESALRVQILVQIQQRAVQSQRAIQITKAQVNGKERERRILQLTIAEIDSVKADVNVYKGVGKM